MAPFENTRSQSMSPNDFKVVLECKDVGNLPDVLDPCFALRDHFQTRGLIGIKAIFSNGSEMEVRALKHFEELQKVLNTRVPHT